MPAKGKNSDLTANGSSQSDKDSPVSSQKEITRTSSDSKSPIDSKISSYFSTSPSYKQSSAAQTFSDSQQSQSNLSPGSSKDCTDADVDQSQTTNQKEKNVEKSPEHVKQKSASRQLLLSPKQDSNSGKKKKTTKSKAKSNKKEETSNQPSITKHFVVRRSQRKCKSKIEEEKRMSIESAILEGREEGLEVRDVDGKGRGVFALKTFERGDLVCEYAGDLIDVNTAREREKKYGENKDIGCYMYYFAFGNKKYCVDATEESGRLGRLLNHSVNGNCTTKVISIKEDPCLILIAAKHINPGEELLYDYGERNKDAIASHPWLQL
ncbi:N-lysine methyltransferase KMT5A-A [Exaiptasia diaphana]|uniref:[histone H4]-lysine(20) N-methyltransferase n=1 Tax=Exaiptasia diaphana TaxID=2652724 RepID=A0A913Y8L4_EXADI|nr:N-lysine methyltransferase KMT5A-A [Exaiptasia diaphana]